MVDLIVQEDTVCDLAGEIEEDQDSLQSGGQSANTHNRGKLQFSIVSLIAQWGVEEVLFDSGPP